MTSVATSTTIDHKQTPANNSPQNEQISGHEKSHEEKHKHIGNYEILKTIGEGSFAKVKLAIHRLTKQRVALKIIDKDHLPDEYSLKNIHREAQIMRLLDHPNIIQLYEVMETKKELFLVLEYAVGGELLDYIVARGRLHEKEARKFFGQIASALEYCHVLNIVHRDLKAEITCCGSPVYSAPELIEGKKYTGPEVDCWSLGINLYAMVVGDLPFADSNLTALYNSILKGVYHVPDFVSVGNIQNDDPNYKECRDLISKLLERTPEKRWSISQIREHSWLTHGLMSRDLPTASLAVIRTRPKVEADIDMELIEQLVAMGFEKQTALGSIIGGKFNQAAGTYYLMAAAKKTELERKARQAKEAAQQLLKANSAHEKSHSSKTAELEALKLQIANERQKTKPGEINPQLNDIIIEYERRKSEIQNQKDHHTVSKELLRPTSTGKPFSQRPSNAQVGIIGPGLFDKNVELSSALLQQQAAYLVPNTPPESKSAALTAGPLSELLHSNDHHKEKEVAVPQKPTSANNNRATPRRREPALTIQLDPTLYLDVTQDEDAKDPNYPDIRTIRFAFNCQTTTPLTPDVMMERLKKVLGKNDVTWRFENYLAECEWGDIKFEVEICKLPRMKMYGLRLKRNAGDMWDYKRLSGKISTELEL
ncbi:MAP/microtubule affinity-regulating kinase 3 [Physocladia obscura]|uniref:non-specific serine/threonine protein kinase n=1 Tax=Physocladia obscura TaxID=109957 RepID=A0AAD5T6X4_9FUNG|nr:MAP/microtubule affinity-regulating kinase 3 [Physocladia obscura]